jgi:HEPN domain-containing protein
MKKSTREWVRKAEADYRLAAKLARGKEPFHDQVCFHCQQAAEKYLKALMEELGLAIPRTHNLDELFHLLSSHHAILSRLRRGLIFLTDFAVGVRYPGENASKRQAKSALRWAGLARDTCRQLLGIGRSS